MPCRCGMRPAPAESSWPLAASRGHREARDVVLLEGCGLRLPTGTGSWAQRRAEGQGRDRERFVLTEPLGLGGPQNGSHWEEALFSTCPLEQGNGVQITALLGTPVLLPRGAAGGCRMASPYLCSARSVARAPRPAALVTVRRRHQQPQRSLKSGRAACLSPCHATPPPIVALGPQAAGNPDSQRI